MSWTAEALPPERQGLFAQGTIGTGQASVLAVPLTAVRTDKPLPYVQVVEGERVVYKAVQTGARGEADNETMVGVQGVAPGALVIKGNIGPLREGTLVRFTATGGPTPSTTGAARSGAKSPSP